MEGNDVHITPVGARYTKSSTQCNGLIALRRSTFSTVWPLRAFQPTCQKGRSLLIGVGRSRHQGGTHGQAGTRFLRGLNSTNAGCGLSSGTEQTYHTPAMLRGHTWLLGFFGEGLPRMAAWRVLENRRAEICHNARDFCSSGQEYRLRYGRMQPNPATG